MRWPYELPTRNTVEGYGLPVDWAKAVSGQRVNWKGSVTVTRTCGDKTIRALEQYRIVLLWKTTPLSRCKKWQLGLTNSPHCQGYWLEIYTRHSVPEAHGRAKTLVLLLKQYHAHYYWFYERGMTRAIVALQRLHSSNAFWPSNVSASVGLKSFCPWSFKLGGTLKQ